MADKEHEAILEQLRTPELLEEYKKSGDGYRAPLLPRILGGFLVHAGNFFYSEEPSYEKFKAVEVIARIPYQSWEVASYTMLTALYTNEKKAIELARTSDFSRIAQDNETLHVVTISQIVKKTHGNKFFLHTVVPIVFSFFYFWLGFFIYVFSPRSSMALNYVFENHAFEQYDSFITKHGEELKKKPFTSEFLDFYGRVAHTEYDLFLSIRNDEIIHRNRSLHEIRRLEGIPR